MTAMDMTIAIHWTGENQCCEIAIMAKQPDGSLHSIPSPSALSVKAGCYPDASYLLEQKLTEYIDELTKFRNEVMRTKLVYEKTTPVNKLPD